MGPNLRRRNYRQKCLKKMSQKQKVLSVLSTVPSYPAQSKELPVILPELELSETLKC